MAPSVSEKIPLLGALASPAPKQSQSVPVHVSSQPLSPSSCTKRCEFVVHLDDPSPDAYPHETSGYLLMFCSSLCFGMMQLAVRLATDYQAFPTSSVSGLQGLALAFFALASILASGDTRAHVARTPHSDLPLVVLRGFLGGCGIYLTISSLSLIPLGTVTSLVCINPIFAIAMSSVVLGESFGAYELSAAFLCFVGVALIANPTLKIDLSQLGRSSYLYGCFLAVLAGWCIAAAFVTVKSYAKRVHYLVSVLSVGVWTMLIAIAMGGAHPGPLIENPLLTAVVIVGCTFGVLSQCFLNKGFVYCRAGLGAVILNADVPISYLLGVLFLAEIPSIFSLFGSTLVTVGALLVSCKNLIVQAVSN